MVKILLGFFLSLAFYGQQFFDEEVWGQGFGSENPPPSGRQIIGDDTYQEPDIPAVEEIEEYPDAELYDPPTPFCHEENPST